MFNKQTIFLFFIQIIFICMCLMFLSVFLINLFLKRCKILISILDVRRILCKRIKFRPTHCCVFLLYIFHVTFTCSRTKLIKCDSSGRLMFVYLWCFIKVLRRARAWEVVGKSKETVVAREAKGRWISCGKVECHFCVFSRVACSAIFS